MCGLRGFLLEAFVRFGAENGIDFSGDGDREGLFNGWPVDPFYDQVYFGTRGVCKGVRARWSFGGRSIPEIPVI
jgi:hypothetical protein